MYTYKLTISKGVLSTILDADERKELADKIASTLNDNEHAVIDEITVTITVD